MQGRVTIYVDSELITSFQADLEQWKGRQTFEIARQPLPQYGIGEPPDPQLNTIKTISLKLFAQLIGAFPEPYICLFFYNYDNPTDKQMQLDVTIAQGQMRNIL